MADAALLAALSVSERIKTYGAYAGFAAVLGLGVLALLYFAQAREVKRLREWAGRAPERAVELEQRVQADAARRAAGVPVRPVAAQTPAAQAARPAAAGAVTPAAQPAASGTPAAPGTPASPGAPAAPGTPSPAVAGAAGAAAGSATGTPAPDKPATPAGTPTPGPAPGATPPATPGSPTPTPAPPVAGATPPKAAAAATGAGATTRAAGDSATKALGTMPPAPSLPKLGSSGSTPPRGGTRGSLTGDLSGGRSRGSGRPSRSALWGLIGAGAVILAVLVILITQVFSGGGSKPAKTSAASPPVIPTRTSGTPSRESFTVTVLNGTTVLNLARSVSDRISAKGYKVIKVDNAPEQGRAATTISYTPGHRADALTVANLVNVGRDAVAPLDPNTQVVSQGASVVVTVGADQSR